MRLAYDCAVAVDYLHSVAIIHTDLKSRNILLRMMGNQLTAKLADFGLACTVQYAKDHKTHRKTWTHAAPELCFREFYNTKETDAYSLAMLMYEIIKWNAESLFSGLTKKDMFELLSQLYRDERDQSLPLPADCPAELSEVIKSGWKIKPNERISASKVKATLFHALYPAAATISVASTIKPTMQ